MLMKVRKKICMKMMKTLLAAGMVLIVTAMTNTHPAGAIDTSKIVDLTYSFNSDTIYWPTEKPLQHEFEKFGEEDGHFYASGKFAAPEHGGTHMDAPIHFNKNGIYADQVPLADCIGPAVVIDFSARAAKDPDAMLSVDDITAYEQKYGRIPDGAIVVARSGWGKFWPDKKRYLGTDQPGDVADLHFPGYSPEAARWLSKNRKLAAIAIDTASMDPGISKEFKVHQIWLGSNKPGFENIANADRLPPIGATIFCIPMKLGKGTGGPTRAFALLP
jgi:kynurenine formamidase